MRTKNNLALLLTFIAVLTIMGPPAAMGIVAAPTSLTATAASDTSIDLKWQDNSNIEDCFIVKRCDTAHPWTNIALLVPDTTSFTDTALTPDTTYTYCVAATQIINFTPDLAGASDSNTASVKTWTSLLPAPVVPLASAPAAPADLIAAPTDAGIFLSWSDNASNELGYRVERQETSAGKWTTIGTLATDATSFNDTGFTAGSSYGYHVIAFNNDGDSQPSNIATATAPGTIPEPARLDTVVMTFYLNSTQYKLNGAVQTMDVAPMEQDGRMLLPIRYVVEPIGITPVWDGISKVTMQNSTTTIELWLQSNTAMVNGVEVLIDAHNPDFMPMSVPPGRIMLPLRFVAENLGCSAVWDPTPPGSAVITYPNPLI